MNFIVRLCSPKSLCGSVAEHQSMESEGLRLDSLWKLRVFLCHTKNIFLYFFTELKNLPSYLFYLQTWCYQHHWSLQYAGHMPYMNFKMGFAQHRVSMAQCQSIRVWNPKVWGSIPHEDSEFLLCFMLVTRWKISFSISLPSSKTQMYHLPYSIYKDQSFDTMIVFCL